MQDEPKKPSPELAALGERIVTARDRAGLTQKELAGKIRRGERSLQNYESGETEITALVLAAIARATSQDPAWLLMGDDASFGDTIRRGAPAGMGRITPTGGPPNPEDEDEPVRARRGDVLALVYTSGGQDVYGYRVPPLIPVQLGEPPRLPLDGLSSSGAGATRQATPAQAG